MPPVKLPRMDRPTRKPHIRLEGGVWRYFPVGTTFHCSWSLLGLLVYLYKCGIGTRPSVRVLRVARGLAYRGR